MKRSRYMALWSMRSASSNQSRERKRRMGRVARVLMAALFVAFMHPTASLGHVSDRRPTTVDHQRVAVDHARLRRHQVEQRRRRILRLAAAPGRDDAGPMRLVV